MIRLRILPVIAVSLALSACSASHSSPAASSTSSDSATQAASNTATDAVPTAATSSGPASASAATSDATSCAKIDAKQLASITGIKLRAPIGLPAADGVTCTYAQDTDAVDISSVIVAYQGHLGRALFDTDREGYVQAGHKPSDLPGVGDAAYIISDTSGAKPGYTVVMLKGDSQVMATVTDEGTTADKATRAVELASVAFGL
jgi:hypothetical protein